VRARVVITEAADGGRTRWTASCTRCPWTYSNVVKSDVQMHKRWHVCPEEGP
jgi:hypothetical protein